MDKSMENVREALKLTPPRPGVLGEINDAILAAALAEVEEWEKTVGILRAVNFTGDEKIASLEARAESAEAEADRLKAALDRIAAIPGTANLSAALIARAALAPVSVPEAS